MNTTEKFLLILVYIFSDIFFNSVATAQTTPFLQCQDASALRQETTHHPLAALCRAFPMISSGECVREELEELKQRDPLLADGPSQVVLIENSQANAFLLDPVRIGITRGLLEAAENHNDLRFVLAHELGHYVLGEQRHIHPHSRNLPGGGRKNEQWADQYAAWLLSRELPKSDSSLNLLTNLIQPETRQSAVPAVLASLRQEKESQIRY